MFLYFNENIKKTQNKSVYIHIGYVTCS